MASTSYSSAKDSLRTLKSILEPNDPAVAYIDKALEAPVMNIDEETQINELLLRGEALSQERKRRLLAAHQFIAILGVSKYQSLGVELQTLIEIGNRALVYALEEFIPKNPFDSFYSHAYYRVEDAILKKLPDFGVETVDLETLRELARKSGDKKIDESNAAELKTLLSLVDNLDRRLIELLIGLEDGVERSAEEIATLMMASRDRIEERLKRGQRKVLRRKKVTS
ncbi:MAG: hypothetical protein H6677_21815 [Candidatus Obscuribacterales bacterium]|nr:hypothetical protein [Cyanobacteria bacterium HKST-UBA01]MCB9470926.1 hypothetical protein [Candidatus Obscuribacterales bacterium]